jgi:hypothetical protein
MEIESQAFFKVDCQAFIKEVQKRIDKGGWYCDETQVRNSLNKKSFISLNNGFDDFTVDTCNIDA